MWQSAAFLAAGALVVCADAKEPRLEKNYAAPAEIGRELIGTKPAEWKLRDWINSEPLTLQQLRGKIVLIRWWTAPGCPYCEASAEALNGWAREHAARGLVVIGIYHHKSAAPFTRDNVVSRAAKFGFTFPVAIDDDWKTLRSWWLDREPRGWTSVTFLLGRDGTIRHIHGGGAYFKGEPGFTALDGAIRKALADDSVPPNQLRTNGF